MTADRIGAIAAVALVSVGVARAMRPSAPNAERTARLLAASVPTATALLLVLDARAGVSWRSYLPLQLCDLAVPIATWALLSRSALAFELTLTWCGVGTLAALITPDVAEGFPHWRFVLYYLQHGGLVAATVGLVASGRSPRPWAALRALVLLDAVALVVGAFDAATGANFMYLRAKPGAATPLDHFGPWPWYLVACELVALVAFSAVCLVARRIARRLGEPAQRTLTSGGT
jgi:hypothetical integral membrane protein (TIGR02206 family)